MKNIMLASVAAIAFAGVAGANESQIDLNVERVLEEAGVSYSTDDMTVGQKAEIELLADSQSPDLSSRIYEILDVENDPHDLAIVEGENQMKAIAEDALKEAGITYDVDDLTAAQMAEIKYIATEQTGGDKQSALYSVVGFDEQMLSDPIGDSVAAEPGIDQMKAQAYTTLRDAGIVYDVDHLSTDQLVEIQLVAEDDSDGNAVNRLEQIVHANG